MSVMVLLDTVARVGAVSPRKKTKRPKRKVSAILLEPTLAISLRASGHGIRHLDGWAFPKRGSAPFLLRLADQPVGDGADNCAGNRCDPEQPQLFQRPAP